MEYASELMQHLAVSQEKVNGALRRALDELNPQEATPRLIAAMRHSLLAPGKRLRPLLTMFASVAVGGSEDQALPAACAVEMVHTYSLIHDDLPAMDDDDLRRGLPTCHKRFDEATAILAGDALLTLAFQLLAEQLPGPVAVRCVRELAVGAGAMGMVGGQMSDLAGEGRFADADTDQGCRADADTDRREVSLAQLESIHARKTGALYRAALRMGAIVGAGERLDDGQLRRLDEFGKDFGLAFQITDDLLDVEGDAAKTGKRTQKDADKHKITYPALLGVQASKQLVDELCQRAVRTLEPFGKAAQPLVRLAYHLARRDR
jgi:geranylgeranyl diphosphate synthase type II